MASEFKIYTKGGDKGNTSLLGGTRVPKYHDRIEAYGTIDELSAFVGMLRDQHISCYYKDNLLHILEKLFIIESNLASDKPDNLKSLPVIREKDILFLEKQIDEMNEKLPELKMFILPGGHPIVSYCHICRTICRRAERFTIKLSKEFEIDDLIIKYLNRLSDYFFVLGRKLALDLKAKEILWNPL